jgi:hypothetical protein
MPSNRLTVMEVIDRYPHAWFTLSRQQRIFVMDYISHQTAQGKYDAEAACRVAYPKVEAVKVWTNRLLINRRIKAFIALHLGLTDAEMLLADIQTLIKRSRRKGANLDILVAPWLRVAAALEMYVAKESK